MRSACTSSVSVRANGPAAAFTPTGNVFKSDTLGSSGDRTRNDGDDDGDDANAGAEMRDDGLLCRANGDDGDGGDDGLDGLDVEIGGTDSRSALRIGVD